MPTEHDDDDHDVVTASVGTTTLSVGSPETGLPSNPSGHIDRPVNAKPTISPSMSPTSSPTVRPSSTATSVPDTFFPHYFPTFGVSKRTQVWIYGALTIIILFCVGLCIYFYVQRQKRLRNSRDDYEFEVLDDQDTNGHSDTRGKPVKRRAGELYDAFAGESDEELLSDDDVEEYKDERSQEGEEEDRGRRPSRDDLEKSRHDIPSR